MDDNVCALGDPERHPGRILKFESRWPANEGKGSGEREIGSRIIGLFPDADSSKIARLESDLRARSSRSVPKPLLGVRRRIIGGPLKSGRSAAG